MLSKLEEIIKNGINAEFRFMRWDFHDLLVRHKLRQADTYLKETNLLSAQYSECISVSYVFSELNKVVKEWKLRKM